jgi:hypothetical protein
VTVKEERGKERRKGKEIKEKKKIFKQYRGKSNL